MGNHLTVLENLYQKKEFIEAEKYTEKLKDRFYRKTTEMNTGNPVTDIILTEKKRDNLLFLHNTDISPYRKTQHLVNLSHSTMSKILNLNLSPSCSIIISPYGQIQEAVEEGATTYDEVQKITRFGTGCGKCREFSYFTIS